MCSSGISIIMKSAPLTASAMSMPVSFAFLTLASDGPPLRTPTVTFTPESCRFNAWAWPCEP